MKIAEKTIVEDDLLVTTQTYDFTPSLERARALRDTGGRMGDSVMVASFPPVLYYQWAREAGVSPNDHDAMAQVVSRKLQSGEYSHFRVWEGSF